MRELEFLPSWYPRIRRRRRLVMIETWMMVLLCAALAGWLLTAQRNVQQAEASLAALQDEQSATDVQLRKLDDLLELQSRWRQQDRIISKLGLHVEATRLIEALDTLMSREMTLLELSLEVDERSARPQGGSARLAEASRGDVTVRKLKVRLRGVTPTGVDLATFLTRLSNVAFFEQVNMNYSRDRHERGYVMREFEVTFSLDLGESDSPH